MNEISNPAYFYTFKVEFMFSNQQIIKINSINLPGKETVDTLDLSMNLIGRLDGIESFRQLKSLNLSNNLIKRLDGLEQLPLLESLNLASNLIDSEEALSALSNLQKLRILTLKGNPIAQQKFIIIISAITIMILLYLCLGNAIVKR